MLILKIFLSLPHLILLQMGKDSVGEMSIMELLIVEAMTIKVLEIIFSSNLSLVIFKFKLVRNPGQ